MTTSDGISFMVDDCQPIRMEQLEQPAIAKKKATKKPNKMKQKRVRQYYQKIPSTEVATGKENMTSPSASKAKRKKKRISICKNFQGFSMANCVYRDEVHMSCYVPPKYATKQTDKEKMDNYFCTDCKLEPCILEHHGARVTYEFERLKETMASELGENDWKALEMGEKMTMTNRRIKEDIMRPIVAEVFSDRYARKRLPGCMLHKVNTDMPSSNRRRSMRSPEIIASIMELEESSDESDEEFMNRYKIRMEDRLGRHSP